MRIILTIIALALAISAVTPSHAESKETTTESNDSLLYVIGWFNKRDTMTYLINETKWKIQGTDTVMNAGVKTLVSVTVNDSTDEGYAMEYKFLDFKGDSLADTELGNFQNRIVESLGKKIAGTTIKFRTDEYGSITSFDNLKQIKKQAKSLFKEATKEFTKIPTVDSLKSIGFDITSHLKKVDADQLVEGYIEELKLLFLCHGMIYELGETNEHEDETDTSYASDTYTSASVDDESGIYTIVCQVDNEIPQEAIKNMVGAIVEEIADEKVSDDFNANFDAQVTDGKLTSTYSAVYFPDGWPSDVINQTRLTVGNTTKITQTCITWEYRSVGHSN